MRGLVVVVMAGCGFSVSVPTTGDGGADSSLDAIDASFDGAPRIWILEAEDYTSRLAPGTHNWAETTTIPGFSGTSYMYLAGGNGTACTSNVVGCASMSYAIALQDGGTYYVHARMWSDSSGNDSVWVSIDDPTAIALTALDLDQDATWKWGTLPVTYTLPAGAHTLTVWHREGGAIVDKVALIQDPTPPP